MPDQPDNKHSDQLRFIQRWSQRKLARHVNADTGQIDPQARQPMEQPAQPTQQSLPALESLHEGSDIGMFLSDDVSESLQRQALRKLFRFGKFNICDGLDDYAEDYTIFSPLEKLLDLHEKFRDISERVVDQESTGLDSAPSTASDTTPAEDNNSDSGPHENDPAGAGYKDSTKA